MVPPSSILSGYWRIPQTEEPKTQTEATVHGVAKSQT